MITIDWKTNARQRAASRKKRNSSRPEYSTSSHRILNSGSIVAFEDFTSNALRSYGERQPDMMKSSTFASVHSRESDARINCDAAHESEVGDPENAKGEFPTMPFRAFNSSQRHAFHDEYETMGSDGKVLIK